MYVLTIFNMHKGVKMKIYEFGNRNNPVLMLLPGTCCLWNDNFGHVIDKLKDKFFVACVSYDGFDLTEHTEFKSEMDETCKLEEYILRNYGGKIYAVYGCSLRGSIVGQLIARGRIKMAHGILGSSDLDQSGKVAALIKTKMLISILYRIIQDKKIKNPILRRKIQASIKDMGQAGEVLVKMFGIDSGKLIFVTKRSMENQFYSDLITKLPGQISAAETKVHIMYALKMGPKYRERYMYHFKNLDIIEFNLYHEELLAVYPDQWVEQIEKMVL